MEVIKTEIEGVVIIEPRLFKDARGYFFESFSQREFDEKVGHVEFVQDNESMSSYGVMRGLHFQRPPFTQAKLVRCVRGGVNAPYIWLKTPGNMTSWEFFDHLLADANVVGTPGSGFGPSGEGYFRLTAFGTYENTVEAVERIKKL